MDKFDKYFWLLALIIGSFLGFLILAVSLFFILKLFSITVFSIPGIDKAYQFLVVFIPYLIFFSGYYYLHKKIHLSTKMYSRILSMLFLVAGSLICVVSLVLSMLSSFKVKNEWLRLYGEHSHYSFIVQIILLFATALIIATGDPKEKDWMEKHNTQAKSHSGNEQ
jgi:hypothetical protein